MAKDWHTLAILYRRNRDATNGANTEVIFIDSDDEDTNKNGCIPQAACVSHVVCAPTVSLLPQGTSTTDGEFSVNKKRKLENLCLENRDHTVSVVGNLNNNYNVYKSQKDDAKKSSQTLVCDQSFVSAVSDDEFGAITPQNSIPYAQQINHPTAVAINTHYSADDHSNLLRDTQSISNEVTPRRNVVEHSSLRCGNIISQTLRGDSNLLENENVGSPLGSGRCIIRRVNSKNKTLTYRSTREHNIAPRTLQNESQSNTQNRGYSNTNIINKLNNSSMINLNKIDTQRRVISLPIYRAVHEKDELCKILMPAHATLQVSKQLEGVLSKPIYTLGGYFIKKICSESLKCRYSPNNDSYVNSSNKDGRKKTDSSRWCGWCALLQLNKTSNFLEILNSAIVVEDNQDNVPIQKQQQVQSRRSRFSGERKRIYTSYEPFSNPPVDKVFKNLMNNSTNLWENPYRNTLFTGIDIEFSRKKDLPRKNNLWAQPVSERLKMFVGCNDNLNIACSYFFYLLTRIFGKELVATVLGECCVFLLDNHFSIISKNNQCICEDVFCFGCKENLYDASNKFKYKYIYNNLKRQVYVQVCGKPLNNFWVSVNGVKNVSNYSTGRQYGYSDLNKNVNKLNKSNCHKRMEGVLKKRLKNKNHSLRIPLTQMQLKRRSILYQRTFLHEGGLPASCVLNQIIKPPNNVNWESCSNISEKISAKTSLLHRQGKHINKSNGNHDINGISSHHGDDAFLSRKNANDTKINNKKTNKHMCISRIKKGVYIKLWRRIGVFVLCDYILRDSSFIKNQFNASGSSQKIVGTVIVQDIMGFLTEMKKLKNKYRIKKNELHSSSKADSQIILEGTVNQNHTKNSSNKQTNSNTYDIFTTPNQHNIRKKNIIENINFTQNTHTKKKADSTQHSNSHYEELSELKRELLGIKRSMGRLRKRIKFKCPLTRKISSLISNLLDRHSRCPYMHLLKLHCGRTFVHLKKNSNEKPSRVPLQTANVYHVHAQNFKEDSRCTQSVSYRESKKSKSRMFIDPLDMSMTDDPVLWNPVPRKNICRKRALFPGEVPMYSVINFVISVIRRIIPPLLFGSLRNYSLFIRYVKIFIQLNGRETLSVHNILQKMQTGEKLWDCNDCKKEGQSIGSAPVCRKRKRNKRKKSTESTNLANKNHNGVKSGNADDRSDVVNRRDLFRFRGHFRNQEIRRLESSEVLRRMILGRLLGFAFSFVVIPVIRAHFYVTESEGSQHACRFFRKCHWAQLESNAAQKLAAECLKPTIAPNNTPTIASADSSALPVASSTAGDTAARARKPSPEKLGLYAATCEHCSQDNIGSESMFFTDSPVLAYLDGTTGLAPSKITTGVLSSTDTSGSLTTETEYERYVDAHNSVSQCPESVHSGPDTLNSHDMLRYESEPTGFGLNKPNVGNLFRNTNEINCQTFETPPKKLRRICLVSDGNPIRAQDEKIGQTFGSQIVNAIFQKPMNDSIGSISDPQMIIDEPNGVNSCSSCEGELHSYSVTHKRVNVQQNISDKIQGSEGTSGFDEPYESRHLDPTDSPDAVSCKESAGWVGGIEEVNGMASVRDSLGGGHVGEWSDVKKRNNFKVYKKSELNVPQIRFTPKASGCRPLVNLAMANSGSGLASLLLKVLKDNKKYDLAQHICMHHQRTKFIKQVCNVLRNKYKGKQIEGRVCAEGSKSNSTTISSGHLKSYDKVNTCNNAQNKLDISNLDGDEKHSHACTYANSREGGLERRSFLRGCENGTTITKVAVDGVKDHIGGSEKGIYDDTGYLCGGKWYVCEGEDNIYETLSSISENVSPEDINSRDPVVRDWLMQLEDLVNIKKRNKLVSNNLFRGGNDDEIGDPEEVTSLSVNMVLEPLCTYLSTAYRFNPQVSGCAIMSYAHVHTKLYRWWKKEYKKVTRIRRILKKHIKTHRIVRVYRYKYSYVVGDLSSCYEQLSHENMISAISKLPLPDAVQRFYTYRRVLTPGVVNGKKIQSNECFGKNYFSMNSRPDCNIGHGTTHGLGYNEGTRGKFSGIYGMQVTSFGSFDSVAFPVKSHDAHISFPSLLQRFHTFSSRLSPGTTGRGLQTDITNADGAFFNKSAGSGHYGIYGGGDVDRHCGASGRSCGGVDVSKGVHSLLLKGAGACGTSFVTPPSKFCVITKEDMLMGLRFFLKNHKVMLHSAAHKFEYKGRNKQNNKLPFNKRGNNENKISRCIEDRIYTQQKGIPQGANFSGLLCALLFSACDTHPLVKKLLAGGNVPVPRGCGKVKDMSTHNKMSHKIQKHCYSHYKQHTQNKQENSKETRKHKYDVQKEVYKHKRRGKEAEDCAVKFCSSSRGNSGTGDDYRFGIDEQKGGVGGVGDGFLNFNGYNSQCIEPFELIWESKEPMNMSKFSIHIIKRGPYIFHVMQKKRDKRKNNINCGSKKRHINKKNGVIRHRLSVSNDESLEDGSREDTQELLEGTEVSSDGFYRSRDETQSSGVCITGSGEISPWSQMSTHGSQMASKEFANGTSVDKRGKGTQGFGRTKSLIQYISKWKNHPLLLRWTDDFLFFAADPSHSHFFLYLLANVGIWGKNVNTQKLRVFIPNIYKYKHLTSPQQQNWTKIPHPQHRSPCAFCTIECSPELQQKDKGYTLSVHTVASSSDSFAEEGSFCLKKRSKRSSKTKLFVHPKHSRGSNAVALCPRSHTPNSIIRNDDICCDAVAATMAQETRTQILTTEAIPAETPSAPASTCPACKCKYSVNAKWAGLSLGVPAGGARLCCLTGNTDWVRSKLFERANMRRKSDCTFMSSMLEQHLYGFLRASVGSCLFFDMRINCGLAVQRNVYAVSRRCFLKLKAGIHRIYAHFGGFYNGKYLLRLCRQLLFYINLLIRASAHAEGDICLSRISGWGLWPSCMHVNNIYDDISGNALMYGGLCNTPTAQGNYRYAPICAVEFKFSNNSNNSNGGNCNNNSKKKSNSNSNSNSLSGSNSNINSNSNSKSSTSNSSSSSSNRNSHRNGNSNSNSNSSSKNKAVCKYVLRSLYVVALLGAISSFPKINKYSKTVELMDENNCTQKSGYMHNKHKHARDHAFTLCKKVLMEDLRLLISKMIKNNIKGGEEENKSTQSRVCGTYRFKNPQDNTTDGTQNLCTPCENISPNISNTPAGQSKNKYYSSKEKKHIEHKVRVCMSKALRFAHMLTSELKRTRLEDIYAEDEHSMYKPYTLNP